MPTPTQELIAAVAAQLPPSGQSAEAKSAHDALALLYFRMESVENCLPRLRHITKAKRHQPMVLVIEPDGIDEAHPDFHKLRKHLPAMPPDDDGEWVHLPEIKGRLAAVEREFAK